MKFYTETFEGPLALLLSLVEERKLALTDVALAEVTQQYVEYVAAHRDEITPENLADFLAVAARLILMKSHALLPFLTVAQQDEEEAGETEDLAAQLATYKQFAAAAERLGALWARGRQCFVRDVPPRKRQIVFVPPEDVATHTIAALFRTVLQEIPTVAQFDHARMRDVVALKERIVTLARALRERGTVAFSSFVQDSTDPIDVVVSFLALLELVKQNAVIAQQDAPATEITLRAANVVK